MDTTTKEVQIWRSFRDAEYRREFSNEIGVGLAFQIRALRHKRGWTEEELASHLQITPQKVARWEDPNYGPSTFNDIRRIANAFDVALLVKLVPFSELARWNGDISHEKLAPESFEEEERSA